MRLAQLSPTRQASRNGGSLKLDRLDSGCRTAVVGESERSAKGAGRCWREGDRLRTLSAGRQGRSRETVPRGSEREGTRIGILACACHGNAGQFQGRGIAVGKGYGLSRSPNADRAREIEGCCRKEGTGRCR